MNAGSEAGAGHRAPVDMAESSRLADATSVLDVFEHRLNLGGGEPSIEEGRAFAFGEAGIAGPTAEYPFGLFWAVASGDGQVSMAPLGMVGAGGIEAAEAR